MSAPHPLIQKATIGVTQQWDATEADKFLLVVNGVGLAGGETVQVYIVTTDGQNIPVFDPTLTAQFKFTATSTRVAEFEGGFLYAVTKDVTASQVGVDVCIKPRTG